MVEINSLGDQSGSVDPVKELPNGRIKNLISALAPEERTSATYSFEKFEEWSQDPIKARVEWLLSLYQKKGWITDQELVELRAKTPDEAYERLRKRCLEKANLRPENERPKEINLDLSNITNDAKLIDILGNYGIDSHNLKMRILENPQRLPNVLMTGNDRDLLSITSYHGGYDGEELVMIRTGVRADQTTYVTDLSDRIRVSYLSPGKPILVYSGDALEYVGPNGYPRSNGFSVFHFKEDGIMQRSLLAVIQCR